MSRFLVPFRSHRHSKLKSTATYCANSVKNTKHGGLERRKNIIAAFQDEIDALDQTALGALTKGSQEYERQLSVYLAKWQENTAHYVPAYCAN